MECRRCGSEYFDPGGTTCQKCGLKSITGYTTMPEHEARMSGKASDQQVGGEHYKGMKIQPAIYCQVNELNHMESSIVKYASRHRDKNGAEDIRKIIHCAQLILEVEYGEED